MQLVLVFSLLALPSFSGIGRENAPSKELSESEFAAILGKYQNFSRMDVSFSQRKTLRDLKLEIPSQGKLTVIRPDTVIWRIDKPDPLKVTINAREISLESGKNEMEKWPLDQVPGKMAGNLKEMILWLKFDSKALYQHFHIYSQGLNHYSFRRRKNGEGLSSFTELAMHLGPERNVKSMRMVEKSGDFIDIMFDEPQFQNTR